LREPTAPPCLRIVQTPIRFHPFVGGVERYVLELSKRLARMGHEVTVIAANEPDGPAIESVERISVVRLPYRWKVANTNVTPGLLKALLSRELDVIHTHIPTPWSADISALVSRIRRKPLIVTYHNDIVGSRHEGVLARLYNATLLRHVLGQAETIVITQDRYAEYSKHLHRYAAKIETIPLGVSPPELIGDQTRASQQLFFLSVLDRHHEYKGLSVLLRAVAQVAIESPNVRLNVGGQGSLLNTYMALAEELGISDNVAFLGYIPDSTLAVQYATSSVFILPSLNSLEGFGIVALEALSYGTPVITTELAGSSSYIMRNHAGLIVRPGDVDGLAGAIGTLLRHEGEARNMGERGRAQVLEEYDWEVIARQFSSLYLKAIQRAEVAGPTKVLIVAPYFAPRIGGLENYAFNIAKQLAARGYEVSVVAANHESHRYKFEIMSGLRVHRVPYILKVSNTPYSPLWGHALRKIIEAEQPDIINAHTPVPIIADFADRVRGDVPLVLTYHNDLVKSGTVLGGLSKLAYRMFMSKTLERADGVIVTSDYYRAHSAHLAPFASKTSIVPPGVEHVPPYVPKRPLFGRRLQVLFVAQLDRSHRHKGFDILLHAAALCVRRGRPVSLTVVGDGNMLEDYRRLAARLRLDDVVFTGYVHDERLKSAYQAADVLAVPSTDASEGFGTVILEAAAYGTPCIAASVGGIPAAVLDGKTGILVEPGRAAALAEVLDRLSTDEPLIRRLGESAHARVRTDFSWDRQGDETAAIIDKLVHEAGR
jgi:glycosyltransferase involved in cell wall biosynthesis